MSEGKIIIKYCSMQPFRYSEPSILPLEKEFQGLSRNSFFSQSQASFPLGRLEAPEWSLQSKSQLPGILHINVGSHWDPGNFILVLFTPCPFPTLIFFFLIVVS